MARQRGRTRRPKDAAEARRQLRVGLQLKAVLVLAFLTIALALVGGWVYFAAARSYLHGRDRENASRTADALALVARDHLAASDVGVARELAEKTIRKPGVRYVALVDAEGRVAAAAARPETGGQWDGLVNLPVSLLRIDRPAPEVLTVVRPVLSARRTLAGGVRLVFDTSATRGELARVQRRIGGLAAAIVLCAIPVGYLLVWRVLVQPVRSLVRATRRVGAGELETRAPVRGDDEIAELAEAFNTMASRVADMRDRLIAANQDLERKVAERTSELQLANRRLRDEMSEKDEFVRAVSHDLNAPLRNIAGMATMAVTRWREALPGDVIVRLQRIQANVEAETDLINELLELSRIRTRPQKPEPVDMHLLIGELGSTFDYELRARQIDLRIGERMPVLHVEKNRIRQVFQNLIDNAIKYMHRPRDGWIAVGYEALGGYHRFSVSDNGPGISPEDQRRVFCVFRRASTAAASGVAGKGVGLALVKSVVANYDGRVRVDSQPGAGTTFSVEFSMARTSAGGADALPGPEAVAEHRDVEPEYHPVGG